MPHIRSKESTKLKVVEKAKDFGAKRALFLARKEAGVIIDAPSIISLPLNTKQIEYLTQKPYERVKKDTLASVLELRTEDNFSGLYPWGSL